VIEFDLERSRIAAAYNCCDYGTLGSLNVNLPCMGKKLSELVALAA
jgi:hypothetical protein